MNTKAMGTWVGVEGSTRCFIERDGDRLLILHLTQNRPGSDVLNLLDEVIENGTEKIRVIEIRGVVSLEWIRFLQSLDYQQIIEGGAATGRWQCAI